MKEHDEIRTAVMEILQDLHEDVDYETEDKLVDNNVLDSFDLVTLATELSDEFDVDISAKDFVADNFNSLDTQADMIARLLKE